ncbi:50S ribosomal protein L25 [Candidatus Saganbacteria bacterium CG08_land_8_20_14_0_20_45_16]|uniref:Large ribosomal subunit protein bL25 n=1 Tax=Candidatus Saganbacteria bacterium CG08_land_8_20_14_0_20_45_16 TaxID=2014293 RepID=A0A2H0Y0L3_UNCSA|nr:MAG: 50S ribosomal protein L25 [Candidatus Saganbacteria bacterium CG08_land_8_20_14_0_20_45_16]
MAQIELKAKKRQATGKKSKKVRLEGLIPAVVYGRKFPATSITIETKEFQKKVLSSEAGSNLLFSLVFGEKDEKTSVPVITHSIQRNPLNDSILHIDFLNVLMDEKIKARVQIELVGLPVGVKDSGGVLVHGLRELEIKCLPGDIPGKIMVDVKGLEIGDSLHVSDLKLLENVEILVEKSEMVATVSAPTKEEEVVPATLAPVGAEGAVPEGEAAVAEKAPEAGAATAKKPAAEAKPAKGEDKK